jgi:hypothetical protein
VNIIVFATVTSLILLFLSTPIAEIAITVTVATLIYAIFTHVFFKRSKSN